MQKQPDHTQNTQNIEINTEAEAEAEVWADAVAEAEADHTAEAETETNSEHTVKADHASGQEAEKQTISDITKADQKAIADIINSKNLEETEALATKADQDQKVKVKADSENIKNTTKDIINTNEHDIITKCTKVDPIITNIKNQAIAGNVAVNVTQHKNVEQTQNELQVIKDANESLQKSAITSIR